MIGPKVRSTTVIKYCTIVILITIRFHVVNFLIRETQVHLVAGEYQASGGFPEKMDWMESQGWTERMGNLEPLEQEVTTNYYCARSYNLYVSVI